MRPNFEQVGEGFSIEMLMQARERTWDAVREIASCMRPGMLEVEAQALAEGILEKKGAQRLWHRTHVRFGINTLKTFSERSLPGVRLQERDVFFIDIGPVWEGYEGDAGASFVLGADPLMERCVSDTHILFEKVRTHWGTQSCSGRDLYKFAVHEAQEMGWQFLLAGASGHRISDFPHRLYYQGGLEELEAVPKKDRWILEIHLRHPTRNFGAFYEDLLC